MTLASAIVRAGYRNSNLLAITASPTAAQEAEGLAVLNEFIGSLFGHEAGQELADVAVTTAAHTMRPNARALVSHSAGPVTLTLPAAPDNGARLQVVDIAVGTARTITVVAAGRLIEGAADVIVPAGTNAVWMYRADTGNWAKLIPLLAGDELPFPLAYDSLFETALSLRLNPRYGKEAGEQVIAVLDRQITNLKFDYRQTGQADEPRTLTLLTRALNIAGMVPPNGQPHANQLADALRRLNAQIDSLFGFEVGEPLQTFPLGQNNIEVPSGFPWGDGYPPQEWWAPLNVRFVCNLTAATTIDLNPIPQNGSRFAVLDASGNFSAFNLTLVGNGRKIEGQDQLVLTEDGVTRQWFYRADLGQWVRLHPITIADEPPFPEAFDQLFEIELAVRLNPAALDDKLIAAKQRMLSILRARYAQIIPTPTQPGLIQRSVQVYPNDRLYWGQQPSIGDSGWAWPGVWPSSW